MSERRVEAQPSRPTLIFDGDCSFCRFWVSRWRRATGDRLEYLPYQSDDVARRFPELPRDRCSRAVQLVERDGVVLQGARAVFRGLAEGGGSSAGWLLYERAPGFAAASEAAYRFIAAHRPLADRVRKWCWGDVVETSTYRVASWSFLRLIGLCYLFAFWSLGTQITGLIGHDGIQPAALYMDAARSFVADQHIGTDRLRMLPTLAWMSTSDAFLRGLCLAGAGLSLLLIAGIGSFAVLPALWLVYLSLSVIARDFLSFQWDALLLEAGLIAVFLAPVAIRERPRHHDRIPWLARGLLLWLLFRLMIGSGAVKLASGDPAWRGLTALAVHYETQPIPTPVAWYAHQLPLWFQKLSTLAVFVVELGVPWLMLGPRRVRTFAAIVLVVFQGLIALTGNYAFFNLLTAFLCVLLVDDAAFRRAASSVPPPPSAWRRRLTIAFAVVTVPVSVLMLAGSLGVSVPGEVLVAPIAGLIQPLRSVNGYGLFAVMTTTRDEIVVEGSDDGREWRAYEFRYKPGDVMRRPPWVAPHQPRLDWQMWFAALAPYEEGGWFQRFCLRLLEGSPDVVGLLAANPFADRPPRFIRGSLYRYHFTGWTEGRRTGAWWTRERIGDYSPPLSLISRP
ncbi:MAG TPA: lipase maturation factor family protein [Vicinamibacterales bacterium]|nr:lipase maturation factor family protein [Vicinamibacterales bacterium]